jgi:Flp pilus assembly protein TadD/uncharacterized protein (AIM24 family)
MRHSQGPPSGFPRDEPFETESRRLTPSIGLARDSEKPTDSSNEDFLFHLYRGSELLQDNRVHEAKEELERALHLQPRDSKGQDLLAVVYFRLGLYPRAIHIYEQLRRTNANDTALLLNLALCYLKTGQPQLARQDLEHLLGLNPTHSRAWGYLGLACERMGDLAHAERAFAQGGHHQMAKRISARRDGSVVPAENEQPMREVREVARAAYQELDAGELSFALAEPTKDGTEARAVVHEPGQPTAAELAAEPEESDPRKPDTRDGPPPVAPSPQQLAQQAPNRRPTLIAPVGAPPAHEVAPEYVALDRLPSQRPPSIALDEGSAPAAHSLRRPVVAVPNPFAPPKSHEPLPNVHGTRTLPPPLIAPPSDPFVPDTPSEPPSPERSEMSSVASSAPVGLGPAAEQPSARPPLETARAPSGHANEPRRTDSLRFPDAGVVLHPSGVALVRTTADVGFAARLESIRAQQSGLKMQLLERHLKGKPNGESFGGVASPMALTTGDGQLVLAARPGRKLAAFAVGGEMCFVREDVLLGFGGGLAFENGRMSTGEGESVAVVQLRGDGSVLLEAIGEILRLTVRPDRSLSVRREVILGWFGRLVPRALAPSDAPCGQRGLVSFAGEGRVLVAST